jgi:hypothetical protein
VEGYPTRQAISVSIGAILTARTVHEIYFSDFHVVAILGTYCRQTIWFEIHHGSKAYLSNGIHSELRCNA